MERPAARPPLPASRSPPDDRSLVVVVSLGLAPAAPEVDQRDVRWQHSHFFAIEAPVLPVGDEIEWRY